ncbi:MAG TPA: MerR family transcriptional regulator [Ilumatobacteraceae bacterium]|nr:MerR family transcriptional regulator [Ilumatobacteraceae bacterium]
MPDSAPPTTTTTPTAAAGAHLSIGEVLALLLEEFPDVTISKIRFLESQGLIDPERTASGYRKFYRDDVELLRCILREQRENYLPLRVIKDRIDSGEIDPTNEHPRPRGIKNVSDQTEPHPQSHPSAGGVGRSTSAGASSGDADELSGAALLFQRTDGTPPEPEPSTSPPASPPPPVSTSPSPEPARTAGAVLPGLLLNPDELCAMAGLTRAQLEDLQSYGVVVSQSGRQEGPFDEDAVEIATISKQLLDAGLEARHLRGWRVAADREAGLLEQLIQPLLRQRNPEARAEAVARLQEFEHIGGRLRAAMMRSSLRQH